MSSSDAPSSSKKLIMSSSDAPSSSKTSPTPPRTSSSDAPSSSKTSKKLTLRSFDGEIFEVEESVAMVSQFIGYLIEDNCTAGVILIPIARGQILAKVIEFCRKQDESLARADDRNRVADEALKAWNADFVKVDLDTLYELIVEEYIPGDDVGKLHCDHHYHVDCIRQWLRQNWCPICKSSACPS